MEIQILDTGASAAEENMLADARLLAQLDPDGPPILHLYDWSAPSATYGHFIDLKKHIDLDQAARHGIAFARRPTGGGIVFHLWDLAFSFLMPSNHPRCSKNTLENYQFVNQIVLRAVQEYLILPETPTLLADPTPTPAFCMARPTIYDVVYRGLKIAGAAQRRTKSGYLHQGTISLTRPDPILLNDLLISKDEVARAMAAYTFAPIELTRLKQARLDLQELLKKHIM